MAVFQTIKELFIPLRSLDPEAVLPAPATTYSIEPLIEKHIKEALELNKRCFANGENYTKNTFNFLFRSPDMVSYRVNTVEGKMAGYLFALLNPDGAAHITTIGVAPEHRRRGLAKMLLTHLEEKLFENNVSTVVLEVRVSNDAARRLYESVGYSITQLIPKYYHNGEDGYLMMRSIV